MVEELSFLFEHKDDAVVEAALSERRSNSEGTEGK